MLVREPEGICGSHGVLGLARRSILEIEAHVFARCHVFACHVFALHADWSDGIDEVLAKVQRALKKHRNRGNAAG